MSDRALGKCIRQVGYVIALLATLLAPLGAASQSQPFEPLDAAKAQSLPSSSLSIESGGTSHEFSVELADTDDTRAIGLMHRGQMAATHGMLFIFKKPQRVFFWMRNTFIPLDMLFLRSDGEIVNIVENVQPHAESRVGPDRPVRAVLELNAGTVARLALKPGDKVHHPVFKALAFSGQSQSIADRHEIGGDALVGDDFLVERTQGHRIRGLVAVVDDGAVPKHIVDRNQTARAQ